MESREVFEKNLARLRRYSGKLASALEAEQLDGVEIVEGRRGGKTLSCDGVLIASAYDPEGEGRRMAEEMNREPADLLVAVGFGLGHHLEAFRAVNPCPIVVYDPSLPRLRAACSIRSSLLLLGLRDVRFALDLDELAVRVNEVYTPGLRIKVFAHPSSLRLDPEKVRDAVHRISHAKRAADVTSATRVTMMAPWARTTIDNAPHLLKTPSFSRLFDAFSGVPAVVAAAGPSLNKQLPLLAREADRLLVIAIGQSLPALRRAGIDPDLTHALESQDISRQFTDPGDASGLSVVLFPSVHPAVYELPVRARFVSYPVVDRVAQWIAGPMGESNWVLGGGSVAQSAVGLAAAVGANPIMLIGQDLAFTDGRVYASGSAYDVVGLRFTPEGRYVVTNHGEYERLLNQEAKSPDTPELELVWVEGWEGGKVPTSGGYASFIERYGELGVYLNSKGVRLVNCTEGGALIRGLEHRRFAEMLEECPAEPVRARGLIHAAYDEAEQVSPTVYREPLRRARASLDEVEREARVGVKRAKSARTALARARRPERKIEILRGVGRCDKKVRRALDGIPWLDSLVQPAIQDSLTAFRKAAAAKPTPTEAVEESLSLFEAVVDAIDQARDLLDRFETRISDISMSESGGETISASMSSLL